jgi:hypothetical protein
MVAKKELIIHTINLNYINRADSSVGRAIKQVIELGKISPGFESQSVLKLIYTPIKAMSEIQLEPRQPLALAQA